MDPQLRFDLALNNAYKKFAYGLHTLCLICRDMTRDCAINLVKMTLLPYFDYIGYLSMPATDKLCTKAQRLQNRALRVALRSPPR